MSQHVDVLGSDIVKSVSQSPRAPTMPCLPGRRGPARRCARGRAPALAARPPPRLPAGQCCRPAAPSMRSPAAPGGRRWLPLPDAGRLSRYPTSAASACIISANPLERAAASSVAAVTAFSPADASSAANITSASPAPGRPRVIPRRHGNHTVRRSRHLLQALPVPRHHAAPGGSILPLQRRHQRHRLREPAGLHPPPPRPRRRARHAFTIRHHQRMNDQARWSTSQQTYRHRSP